MPPAEPGNTRAYHHGALRDALIDASEALLAERGLEGFTLREVARRAGVSPAAPAHHFGDVRGLLTAVATRAFEELESRLTRADEAAGGAGGDRRVRLRAQGEAYIRFALDRPGLFDLMFRVAKLDTTDPVFNAAGDAAFAVLERAVSGDASASGPGPDSPPGAIVAWSLVHGFARLALDGQFGGDDQADWLEAPLAAVLDAGLGRVA
jgi:AcrR family transcriptional regulator